MNKIHNMIRLITRMLIRIRHNRISLFWIVTVVALSLPWLMDDISGPILTISDTPGALDSCSVVRVYDGDTMTVNCAGQEERVRLYCIDTPEMGQQPWGRQSRDYLRRITPSQVEIVTHDRDRYGRLVGEVLSGNRSLNLAMVEAGQAAVYNRYCSDDRYAPAERQAKAARLGVWAEPGLHQQPWEWRSL